MSFELARRLVLNAIGERVCPAASIEAGTAREVLWREAFGTITYDASAPVATPETVFDLASLTKVIATTSLAMRLCDAGAVTLDAPVSRWVPAWSGDDRRGVTLRDLLEHASGLPGWAPLYESCVTRSEFESAVCGFPLEFPPRTASLYSDLGFMLLGWVLERAGDAALDVLWSGVAEDLGCGTALRFGTPPEWRTRVAPTRIDPWRGRLLVGEVDDNNAWGLGGVAGHAGLFGTAPAVGAFARTVLRALRSEPAVGARLARPETVCQFAGPSRVAGSSRALGWDTMLPTSSCGVRMSPGAIGHTGFTGTSLWIDPLSDFYVVMLTNRVHPGGGSNTGIQQLRRALHDEIAGALAKLSPSTRTTTSG